jgi:hypothetical protein
LYGELRRGRLRRGLLLRRLDGGVHARLSDCLRLRVGLRGLHGKWQRHRVRRRCLRLQRRVGLPRQSGLLADDAYLFARLQWTRAMQRRLLQWFHMPGRRYGNELRVAWRLLQHLHGNVAGMRLQRMPGLRGSHRL